MLSLHARILLAATLVLVAFFGVTGLVLDGAYRHSAWSALQERLQGYAYALVAVMEPDAEGRVHITNALPCSRRVPASMAVCRATTGVMHGCRLRRRSWIFPFLTICAAASAVSRPWK